MEIRIKETKSETSILAANHAAETIRSAIDERGSAGIILATGASQIEMLGALTESDVDWSRVTVFHLDEYIGLPITHQASFRKFLKERFESKVDGLRAFHYIDGENPDPGGECRNVGDKISSVQIDLACVGIGENGHLAFNDPPADFDIDTPYIIVELDEACRRQQFGEGWFATFDAVPKVAISMSVRQIMKSRAIVCTVPDARKAEAVKNTLDGEITPDVPASILRNHPNCHLFIDAAAASRLNH